MKRNVYFLFSLVHVLSSRFDVSTKCWKKPNLYRSNYFTCMRLPTCTRFCHKVAELAALSVLFYRPGSSSPPIPFYRNERKERAGHTSTSSKGSVYTALTLSRSRFQVYIDSASPNSNTEYVFSVINSYSILILKIKGRWRINSRGDAGWIGRSADCQGTCFSKQIRKEATKWQSWSYDRPAVRPPHVRSHVQLPPVANGAFCCRIGYPILCSGPAQQHCLWRIALRPLCGSLPETDFLLRLASPVGQTTLSPRRIPGRISRFV